MRRNTVTCWTTADFAIREACSFIRPQDAFRKTLVQSTGKKSRKLTDHRKQLLPYALISSVTVLCHGESWEMICRGGVVKDVNSIKNMFFVFSLLQLVRGFLYWKHKKKNGQVLNKPQMRQLLKNPGGTFLQIQRDFHFVPWNYNYKL